MRKALVTGGAGFIGSHIAEALVAEGFDEVIALDNLTVGRRENVSAGVTLVVGDIRDAQLLRTVLEGAEAVFHNAAFVSIRGSFDRLEDDLDVNCNGTLRLLRASVEAQVKKFVFASSMAVYGEPATFPVREDTPLLANSPYGLSKGRGEMYCRIFAERHGIETTVLRYFNTFGPRQTPSPYVGVVTTFISQALSGRPLTVYGDGSQRRDFVGVKDVANANILALRRTGGGVFNVASGSELSVEEVADEILRCLGKGEKVHLPPPSGEIPRMLADISRARDLLAFTPTRELRRSIPELIREISHAASGVRHG